MMKKAIVTGADGFIGQNLVREMLSDNYEVYAVVMDLKAAEKILGADTGLKYIECDMDNYSRLTQYDELSGADLLFHLAWAGVSDKSSADHNVQMNNVKCSCDLQTAASKLGIKRMIFSSSIMEYEHCKAVQNGFYNLPLRNTYHILKYAARNLLQLLCNNSGMEYIPVVISNIYGVGENSPRLINTAIRNLINKQHMSFTPSEQLYDFIYITDAVKAIKTAAERGTNNKIYYIGNPKPRPLKEFLYELRDVAAPDMELGIGELPLNGVSLEYNELDLNGLYDDLDFKAEITFKHGIQMTAEWIRANEN